MPGDLYIVVTNTYLNIEYYLFTATEDVPVCNIFPKSMEIIEAETVSETFEISSALTKLNN
jgi:hypothetical protein